MILQRTHEIYSVYWAERKGCHCMGVGCAFAKGGLLDFPPYGISPSSATHIRTEGLDALLAQMVCCILYGSNSVAFLGLPHYAFSPSAPSIYSR